MRVVEVWGCVDMSDDLTVACDSAVRCQLSREITPTCPVTGDEDRYDVQVSWTPISETFEKHALADHIDAYAEETITQERLAELLSKRLSEADVANLQVTIIDTRHVGLEVIG
jgi:NADPH-dependent 7-cyano-7-deazaguanine reductase QueF